jgi:hypothetical protein
LLSGTEKIRQKKAHHRGQNAAGVTWRHRRPFSVEPAIRLEQGSPVSPRGGRRWWAHLAFTRLNTDPIILRNQIEDLMDILGLADLVAVFD